MRAVARRFWVETSRVDDLLHGARGRRFDRDAWQRMATDIGVQGLVAPESLGGAGLDLADLGPVLEEAGRALCDSPLESTVTALLALSACRSMGAEPSVVNPEIQAIAAGEQVAAVVLGDGVGAMQSGLADVDGSGRLSGRAPCVPAGDVADLLVVAAGTIDDLSLHVVRTNQAAVTASQLQSMDLTRRFADLHLEQALLSGESAHRALVRARSLAVVVQACEALGSMQSLLEMTVAYVSDRRQFGRPIGSFQSVKHVCADMLVDVESTRALVDHALSATGDYELQLASALVQVRVSAAHTRVAMAALMMHGAIAYTWEHAVHLHLRRAKTAEALQGSVSIHRRNLLDLAGFDTGTPGLIQPMSASGGGLVARTPCPEF